MQATVMVEIPQELAESLHPIEKDLPKILELGLREWNASKLSGFESAGEIFEFFANLPTPEEILALRPSETLQARIRKLLEKNRETGLNAEEDVEWAQYQYVEHLVRIAKAKAHLKLQGA